MPPVNSKNRETTMSARNWSLLLALGLVLASVFFCFPWFKTNEHVAIWLEGVALVAIFGLDFFERKSQERERDEQHKETIEALRISRDQAQAAIRAADAAKKSADIAAALHRPLIGLHHFQPTGDINSLYWSFNSTIRNYGTLPASSVAVVTEFFIDGALRYEHRDTESIQIFPSNQVDQVMGFNLAEDEKGAIPSGRKILGVKIRVRYQQEDGRKFEYFAQGNYKQQRIDIADTSTREIT
jgi:hypothetical protein